MSHLIGAHIEFAIAQFHATGSINEGAAIRGAFDLGFNQLVQTLGIGIGHAGRIPINQQLTTFARTKHGQGSDFGGRLLHHRAQKILEMADHPLCGRLIKEIRVIFQRARQPLGAFTHHQIQIKLGHVSFQIEWL